MTDPSSGDQIETDDQGGWFDGDGNYHTPDGGYYDPDGNFWSPAGGYFDPDGNYYAPDGSWYDATGEYHPASDPRPPGTGELAPPIPVTTSTSTTVIDPAEGTISDQISPVDTAPSATATSATATATTPNPWDADVAATPSTVDGAAEAAPRPDLPPPNATKPPTPVKTALEWGAIIIGAFVAALLIKTYLFQAFFIPTASMLPTLDVHDRVIVNKLSYKLHDINRGDLVVFIRPPDSGGDPNIKDLIKRVIALPGETIEVREGRVVIDGRTLDEPYLVEGLETSNLEKQTIPEDHVFVMGDNRGDSRDSRFFGPVHEDLVIGRAFVRVWPLDHIDFL